jgi:hypothetical protein
MGKEWTYNLLDPAWTYGACKHELFKGMHWRIQNFGVKKKKQVLALFAGNFNRLLYSNCFFYALKDRFPA